MSKPSALRTEVRLRFWIAQRPFEPRDALEKGGQRAWGPKLAALTGRNGVVTAETMAWAHDGRLSVVVHGESSPSSLEWSRFLNYNRSLRDPRVLVCTYGGGPDGKQRRELMEDAFYGGVPTVIMTNSVIARGIVTTLNWFNPNMKAVPLHADAMAHGLLGLSASEAARAVELREMLERELRVGRFAVLAAGGSSQELLPEKRPR